MSFTFHKSERLTSKKSIQRLFEKNNHSFNEFPFRFVWVGAFDSSHSPVQVMFAVPRRTFPKATQRNRIKRQMRELYRTEKDILYKALQGHVEHYALLITYISKDKKIILNTVRKNFHKSIIKLGIELSKNSTVSILAGDKNI